MLELQQVISQIIAFLLMLWILKRFAWKPLLGILDARQERIRAELADIEKRKKDLDTLEHEYQNKLYKIDEKTTGIVQEAQKKGREHAKELILEAQGQARGIINKALLDAEKEALKVKENLKNEMATATIALTEKLIRQKMDPEDQKKLALEFLNEANIHDGK